MTAVAQARDAQAGGSPGLHAVEVLCNGRWVAPGTVIFMHPYGRHDPVDIVQNFFAIRGGGHLALVDTGVDALESYLSPADRERLGASRSTAELLAGRGIRPEDVDTLILTHLHFDHYLNAALFPRARVVVNRKEWEFAMSPANRRAMPRSGFPREVFAWLAGEAWDRLELVEGEAEIVPGIRVIETGGHSPGHQIVVVETAAGPVVIPGDEIYLYENLERDIPIGYYHDFDRVSRAMDLIRSLGRHVLPAHDADVARRHPSGVIG
jgi:glyoxylase-like metal-dependent hydrolase (beta-lactamase superfamily II)